MNVHRLIELSKEVFGVAFNLQGGRVSGVGLQQNVLKL